jgi:hypothetical protein
VGDNTGWTPPNGSRHSNEAEPCCTCGSGEPEEKKAVVEYLYLDLKTCDRCLGTDRVLDGVLMTLTPALALAGYEVEYYKIEIENTALAEKYAFLSSPTIRVNGRDIFGTIRENSCGCCSDISGSDVNCRVFEFEGETHEIPPKEIIAEAILKNLFAQTADSCSCGAYTLPENLKSFFNGKTQKSGCSCGGDCC